MIRGIGTDLIELARIEVTGIDRLAGRILTASEQEYLPHQPKRRLEYVAGRFSAKEAIAKALGTGIGEVLSFQDIQITTDAKGKPYVTLSERAHHHLFGDASVTIHLSISHSDHYANAMAVVEEIRHIPPKSDI